MDSGSAQLGVLGAGGVLLGVPVVATLRRDGSLPTAKRLTVPLVVIGGCALLSQIAPWLGLGLAWLAALGLALNTPWAGAKPKPAKPAPGGTVPRAPAAKPFAGGGGGAW